MKKILLSIFALFACAVLSAQVGIGTTTPSNASNLEVSASDDGAAPYRGFMPPRVRNIAQRNGIAAGPFDYGLLVFVTDTGAGVGCLQIWTGTAWEDVYCTTGTITVPPNPNPWINEMHYDDDSGDLQEGFEIAGAANIDLTDYQIIRYNGATGAPYNTTETLSGSIDDEGAGFGAVWFPITPIQNGGAYPDGVALYQISTNTVIQLLSYEGTFEATSGPAMGMNSTDIGVEENNATPAGFSLQVTGSGNAANNFTWQAPTIHSRGDINPGQIIF